MTRTGTTTSVLAALAATLALALLVTGGAAGATRATAGVVVIETNLAYASGSAAGTGMVVTSSGVVITNNHVIKGATSIRVIVPGTRRSYAARVVGYAISPDVAVLRLTGASGLTTVSLGTSSGLVRGQSVTAVGNAGGTGSIVTASGTIRALDRTITVSDEQGGSTRMSGLIQTDADLRPGDSGGPLVSSSGSVVGMDTAASGNFMFDASSEGYAIPIDRVVATWRQIRGGRSTATVHVGPTAFLGILGAPASRSDVSGAIVVQVVAGGPAQKAGLAAGDVITRVDGRTVSSTWDIASYLLRKRPGDTVTLSWVDRFARHTTGSARLTSGPPQ